MSKIEHNSGSGKKNLSFDYDAMGHRIAKHVYDDSWSLEKSTYYLLDAQGNTMSVYEYIVDAGSSTVTYAQEEKYIYGSSRVGVLKETVYLLGSVTLTDDMSNQVHISGQRSYELTNHLGNVLSVISDMVIPHDDDSDGFADWYLADILQSTDYSPFGVTLHGRNFTRTGAEKFRFGFNNMEADDEVKGAGNSYDFGARLLDPRIGRFLSIDPDKEKLPSSSPYGYAKNSPIIYIDFGGMHPKVAIIMEDVPKSDVEGAFRKHEAALRAEGYEVVYVRTAKEALDVMNNLSTPESPIENLIIISHASPSGPNNSNGGGFYTDPEMRYFAKNNWKKERWNEIFEQRSADEKAGKTVNWDENIQDQVDVEAEEFWNGVSEESINAQNKEIEDYKAKFGAVGMDDLSDAVSNGDLSFAANATIVIGGCNAGGYPAWKNDKQETFSTTLAKTLKLTVFSSEGWTGPGLGATTTERVSNSVINARDLKGTWYKTSPDGTRTNTGSPKINMAKPK